MKLPTINLSFFKNSAKKKRTSTTLGKRSASVSASTAAVSRRAHHSFVSNPKSRKRSNTYYAPSKSKIYSSDHYPSMHRMVRHTASAVPTSPSIPRTYSYEQKPIISAHFNPELNNSLGFPAVNETFHSYAAKQTYLCGKDYGDIVLHQPPAGHMLPQSQALPPNLTCYKIDQNIFAVTNNNTYPEENATQAVPINSSNAIMVNVGDTDMYSQNIHHNLLPSNIGAAYATNPSSFASMNYPNTKYSKSSGFRNGNNSQFYAIHQPKASKSLPKIAHGIGLPIYKGAKIPLKKKSDRQRKRKVRHLKNRNCMQCFRAFVLNI